MTSWYEIARPHADIREGDFDENVFAAKLGDVVDGTAPDDYTDPQLFFRKTYLTDGLERLLQDVHRRLTAGTGPGVVELQTPFGGGKTHSLVTVYHYLKHGPELSDQLPEGLAVTDEPSISTIVGTELNPAEGTKSGGVTRKTLWGEVAFQLGGEAAYEQIAGNDIDQVSPGKRALKELLQPLQPFVLLFDEILEYVVRARGVAVHEDSLGAQTLAFFQELTEVMDVLENGLMLVTLPSSDMEDFGDKKLQNLQTLNKVFGRVESIAAPVRDDEVPSIIRQRLFEEITDQGAVQEVVDRYFSTYQENKDDLPDKVRDAEFRRQMLEAYPFHPHVINVLYQKWSTFPDFQRTRGALRLLANVVEHLWEEDIDIELILPGDVSLEKPGVRREFLRHIGQEYDGVISSDIAGSDAKSQALDRDHRDWKHLAERIATSVFLHSFSAGEAESGVKMPYIKLSVLRPETTPALVTEIIQRQANQLWYLNQRAEEYFFTSVPNLNRMILSKKDVVSDNQIREELQRQVRKALGNEMQCHLWPKNSGEIPDNDDLKLAVIDPRDDLCLKDLEEWVQSRGDGFRVNKNTVFFALPDSSRVIQVEDNIREMLALEEIQGEIADDDRPAMEERRTEVKRRLSAHRDQMSENVLGMYRTVAVPSADNGLESFDLGQPSLAQTKLDEWYWRELTDSTRHQKILDDAPSPAMLRAKFLDNREECSLEAVLAQFHRNPELPVPGDRSHVARGVAQGVEQGLFGYAMRVDGQIEPSTVVIDEPLDLSWVGFQDDEFLLEKSRARSLKAKAKEEEEPGDEGDELGPGDTTGTGDEDDEEEAREGEDDTPKETLIRRLSLRAEKVSSNDFAAFASGVIRPLTREVGEFELSVEFDISSEDGIAERVIEHQVRETLQQLGIQVSDLTTGE